TTVEKQIVQDDTELSMTLFFGSATSAQLVNFQLGSQNREPIQLSTGGMLDLATANLLSQIFKVSGCEPTQNIVVAAN
ncbi:MAG: hypothetical protein JWO43_76, partial [Candidatus Adlerbacteria bacterium]|nr:hypothetical protein [Candidatus Adlerbacteria bacterium]